MLHLIIPCCVARPQEESKKSPENSGNCRRHGPRAMPPVRYFCLADLLYGQRPVFYREPNLRPGEGHAIDAGGVGLVGGAGVLGQDA